MLQSNDKHEKHGAKEHDRQNVGATTNASLDIIDETNLDAKVAAAAISVAVGTTSPNTPSRSGTAKKRQSESLSSTKESSGSKRKERNVATPGYLSNESVSMPIGLQPATTGPASSEVPGRFDDGVSAAGQQLLRMQVLERQQQQLLEQQINETGSHGSFGPTTVANVIAQYQRSQQQAQENASVQQPPFEAMMATNGSLRQQLSNNTLTHEQQYHLLLEQRLQHQRDRLTREQQALSQFRQGQIESAARASLNEPFWLQQLSYLNSDRQATIQQPYGLNYREQLAAIGSASINRNTFQQLPQQYRVSPPMQQLQPSIAFGGSAELQQLLLANQRMQNNPFSQVHGRSATLEDTLLGSGGIPNHLLGRSIQRSLGETLLGRGTISTDQLVRSVQGGLQWGDNEVYNNINVPLQLPATLSHDEDPEKLSPHQILLRQQIEAFQATQDDVSTHTRGRNKPIELNQVGIRCRHCAHLPVAKRQKGSTYFPATILGIYQASQNMSTTHIQNGLCSEMPIELKQQFENIQHLKVTSSGAGRPYWGESARRLGLVDTEQGIQFIRSLPFGARVLQVGNERTNVDGRAS